jgi:7-keto-8-aminopelargonate synthetase-like enzyme
MGLFDKHIAYRDAYNAIRQAGADPFSVRFDAVVSPTEGVINGKRTILLGTNNYLGLTFDEQAIASSVKAVQERGTGTTGSRIANGSFEAHVELEDSPGQVLQAQARHGVHHRLPGQSGRAVDPGRPRRPPDPGRRQPRLDL